MEPRRAESLRVTTTLIVEDVVAGGKRVKYRNHDGGCSRNALYVQVSPDSNLSHEEYGTHSQQAASAEVSKRSPAVWGKWVRVTNTPQNK